jgi:hypothetical protein
MKKAALLTAGALALPLAFSLPAMAQQNQKANPAQAGQQQPMQQPGQNNQEQSQNSGQNEQQNGQAAQLNQDQIKQVQQALDRKGFKAGHADGRLGEQTKQALSKFQRSQNIQQTGQPDEQTLQALGINVSGGGGNGAGTTGAAPSGQGPGMDQNQAPANNAGGGNKAHQ